MTWAVLLPLLLKALPFVAAIVGFLGWGKYKERVGASREQAKQAAAEQAARDIRDQVDNDLGALTPEQRREELRKHARD